VITSIYAPGAKSVPAGRQAESENPKPVQTPRDSELTRCSHVVTIAAFRPCSVDRSGWIPALLRKPIILVQRLINGVAHSAEWVNSSGVA
jgi:hypothetical protein